ncbi:MAG: NAD(P)-dependent glycerol-1-phosphate dehydrogenase [Candidatus Bathyarchaeota archaeon]|jgi:glycerol-1-phosphate dehydrogenase [NAD(P)+]|nr:NAD(P)-dependent glycerol-1-phosphate dehydrogenase [Candidatus Bathyarchaeota archaeon A05DMB-5]MDH7557857.1 NAD(P)-dependent glycerol-1-phosphate dehydrogenase [Candidatus Bathyarchaeota archaeon]
MQLPREVIVGNGTIEHIGKISRRLGFTQSALIIAGSKTYEIAGKTVKKLLEKEGMAVDVFLVESATVKDVETVEEKIKILKPEVVFGVGGGTKIDVAKLSSARQEIPFISVPTTASHDSIASPLSSVKGYEKPYSIMAQAPIAIVADTNIIMQAPWRFLISGCGDIISKFTAVRDWKLAHEEKNEYYGSYAASLALMSAKLVMENAEQIKPDNEEGVRVVIEALISCGVSMSIAGSSRPCSGSEHLFAHALDMIKPNHTMHGERCGVGTIMMAYLHRTNWKRIRDTLKKLGAPTNTNELGIEKEDAVKALEIAATIRPERYTILNKLNLNHATCEKIAETTEVIESSVTKNRMR